MTVLCWRKDCEKPAVREVGFSILRWLCEEHALWMEDVLSCVGARTGNTKLSEG